MGEAFSNGVDGDPRLIEPLLAGTVESFDLAMRALRWSKVLVVSGAVIGKGGATEGRGFE
jgi:hypothetical protein